MRYNIYKIYANMNYCGASLVAANSVDEANEIISVFQKGDKENNCDSRGYCFVSEADIIEDIYSERSGIMDYGIYYSG